MFSSTSSFDLSILHFTISMWLAGGRAEGRAGERALARDLSTVQRWNKRDTRMKWNGIYISTRFITSKWHQYKTNLITQIYIYIPAIHKVEQNQNNSYITSQMNNLPILFCYRRSFLVYIFSLFVDFNHSNCANRNWYRKEKINTFSQQPIRRKRRKKMQNLNVHVLKKRLEKHLNYNALRTHFKPPKSSSLTLNIEHK